MPSATYRTAHTAHTVSYAVVWRRRDYGTEVLTGSGSQTAPGLVREWAGATASPGGCTCRPLPTHEGEIDDAFVQKFIVDGLALLTPEVDPGLHEAVVSRADAVQANHPRTLAFLLRQCATRFNRTAPASPAPSPAVIQHPF